MNDARWHDVLEAARSSARHFASARRLFDDGDFGADGQARYRDTMALLHAMQSGHTSFEVALLRTMSVIGEQAPTGADWHTLLITRAAAELPGSRPAILTPSVAVAAHATRGFRHLAMHSYDFDFDPKRASSAIAAGEVIACELPELIVRFARRLDG